MVYSSCARHIKQAAHWGVENTFPSTAGIATTTAFVSWYSYQVGMTYSQSPITSMIVSQMGYSGYAAAPLIVPWLSPIFSSYFSVGASCCTSLTLNIISKKFFSSHPPIAKPTREEQKPFIPSKQEYPLEILVEPEKDKQKKEEPDHIIIQMNDAIMDQLNQSKKIWEDDKPDSVADVFKVGQQSFI